MLKIEIKHQYASHMLQDDDADEPGDDDSEEANDDAESFEEQGEVRQFPSWLH